MKYCKNCKREIMPDEETYNDLCLRCYQEYLFEKVEHIGKDDYVFKSSPESIIIKKIKNFFKNIFAKNKK